MIDETEAPRRERQAELNVGVSRSVLEAQYGQVWDTDELSKDFSVKQFLAPYVMVERKSDGVVGTLEFQHQPRFYFNFESPE